MGIPSTFQFFTLLYCVSDTFCDIQNGRVWRKLWGTEFVISSFNQGVSSTRCLLSALPKTLFLSNAGKGLCYEYGCVRGRHGAVSFQRVMKLYYLVINKERDF